MINNPHHSRFSSAPWYSENTETFVMVGGAGGIGSWVSLLLARAGFKPIIYDFDTLETHNMSGQLFGQRHIEQQKVVALQEIIKDFTGEDVLVFDERIDKQTPANNYTIAAFDNMKARRDMFETWNNTFGDNEDAIFIDGRLTGEQMFIFSIKGGKTHHLERIEYMQNHLPGDDEVEDAPCTLKQTSHSAAMIASHIVAFFTNFITNVKAGEEEREVPFSWEYFIPMNMVTQQMAISNENTDTDNQSAE